MVSTPKINDLQTPETLNENLLKETSTGKTKRGRKVKQHIGKKTNLPEFSKTRKKKAYHAEEDKKSNTNSLPCPVTHRS